MKRENDIRKTLGTVFTFLMLCFGFHYCIGCYSNTSSGNINILHCHPFTSILSNETPPHLISQKTVSPSVIYQYDSVGLPNVAYVTLRVTAVGDPYNGNDTAAIAPPLGSMITEMLPPPIGESTWNVTPNNTATILSGQLEQDQSGLWKFCWDVPIMKIGDIFEVRYEIVSFQHGWQPIGVNRLNATTLYGSDWCKVSYEDYQYYKTNSTSDIWTNDTKDISIYVKTLPEIQLISPIGNEIWEIGTVQTIKWTAWDSVPLPPNPISINYSVDDGFTWNLITTNAPNNGTFTWVVPNTPSNIALIRVTVFNSSSITTSDTSPNPFTIIHGNGWIQGHVIDSETGYPIQGALIQISSLNAYSDGSGYYKISGISPGIYDIEASELNYTTEYQKDIFIDANGETVNFSLSLTSPSIIGSVKITPSILNTTVGIITTFTANALTSDSKVIIVPFTWNITPNMGSISILSINSITFTANMEGFCNLTAQASYYGMNKTAMSMIIIRPLVSTLTYVKLSISSLRTIVGNDTSFTASVYGKYDEAITGATFNWSLYPLLGTLSTKNGDNTIFTANKIGICNLSVNVVYRGIEKNATANIYVITSGNFTIYGTVYDENNKPIIDANVSIESVDGSLHQLILSNNSGFYSFIGLDVLKIYIIKCTAPNYNDYTSGNLTSTTGINILHDIHMSKKNGPSLMPIYLQVVFLMLGLVIAGFIFTIVPPLYSRIRRDKVLDHFIRGQVYEFIRHNPGAHFSEIKRDLSLSRGTLGHHLRTLEMQGFIKSKIDGIFRRYYEIEINPKDSKGLRYSKLQRIILKEINKRPGLSQTELAEEIGVSSSVFNYNLKVLIKAGEVKTEAHGKENYCYATKKDEPMSSKSIAQ